MSKQKQTIKQIGVVGVDSGQIIITDPCYLDGQWQAGIDFDQGKIGDFSYGGACQTADNDKLGGQLNYRAGHAGAGIVVRSGYGDGVYPVYALYNDEGRVTKLVVDFEALLGEASRKIFDVLKKE